MLSTFRESHHKPYNEEEPLILLAADEGREDVRSPSFNYHEDLEDKEMKCTLPLRKNTETPD